MTSAASSIASASMAPRVQNYDPSAIFRRLKRGLRGTKRKQKSATTLRSMNVPISKAMILRTNMIALE